MRFIWVDIEEFMALRKAHLALNERGLLLMQGDNQVTDSATSNGAGKSSVPDAISWCLFGVTARGESGNEVVNNKAKKNTCVEVMLEDEEGWRYLVRRHRKHKEHKNRLYLELLNDAGESKDLTRGTDKETQKEVERVLGCSVDVFNSAIYAGQEQMPDLPGMTDKYLKLLVEEAAGVDQIARYHEIARERHREAKKRVDTAETALNNAENSVAKGKSEVERLKEEVETWESARKKAIADGKENARAYLAKAKELKAQLEKEDREGIEEEMHEIDRRIGRYKREMKELEELKAKKVAAEKKLERQKATLRHIGMSFKSLQSRLDDLDSKKGMNCGECGRPYDEESLAEARETLRREKGEKASDWKAQKAAIAETEAEIERCTNEVTEYENSMTDVHESRKRYKALASELERIRDIERSASQRVKEARALSEHIEAKKAEANPYRSVLDRHREQLAEDEQGVEELATQLIEERHDLALLADAEKVFGPAGVRAHILDTVTPYLNDRTAHYLGILSDGAITAVWNTIGKTTKGELREKFHIEVESTEGAKTFKGLSGGEKRKVRLATAMALQDLVASRAEKPIRLFVADEIDDSIDGSGLERLMGVLEERARERGTVLVISHNELSDWIREQVVVTKTEKGSYLSEV